MKIMSAINPAITENMEDSLMKLSIQFTFKLEWTENSYTKTSAFGLHHMQLLRLTGKDDGHFQGKIEVALQWTENSCV